MIRLELATTDVARAVLAGQAELGVPHVADWPHEGTADALRPLAEYPDESSAGTFLVVEDDVVVGECGWLGPPVAGEVTIRYGVAPSARGRGTGSEAVRLLIAWVMAHGAGSVRAEVRPSNEPSLRLLRGLEFLAVGEQGGYLQLLRRAVPST